MKSLQTQSSKDDPEDADFRPTKALLKRKMNFQEIVNHWKVEIDSQADAERLQRSSWIDLA